MAVSLLVVHESNRVILDRLSTAEDRRWYKQTMPRKIGTMLIPESVVSQFGGDGGAKVMLVERTFLPLTLPMAKSLKRENLIFEQHQTLRVGGASDLYVQSRSEDDLKEVVCHLLGENEDAKEHAGDFLFTPPLKALYI